MTDAHNRRHLPGRGRSPSSDSPLHGIEAVRLRRTGRSKNRQERRWHLHFRWSNEAAIHLATRILDWASPGMSRVFFGLSGSDANETQVKIAWCYNNVLGRPNKKKIISRQRGYHGCTVIAGSLTGLPFYHKAFDLPQGPVLHTTNPHHYFEASEGISEEDFSRKCAVDLEQLIVSEGPETVAAFIGEPVLGTGGIIPPPEGYWVEIQRVLKKYDVLLIADEVVTGFGRLGEKFGSHLYAMQPDLITIAKGLTSGYIPLSGVIVGERVWGVLKDGSDQFGPFSHGYTSSAHPIAAAAGLANLDVLEREDLTTNAKLTGAYFQGQMQKAFGDHPIVGEVRGRGLLCAIECIADKKQKTHFNPELKVGTRLSAACLEQGLIARAMPHGDILGFAPPLIITPEQVDDVVARTQRAFDTVLATLDLSG